MIHPLTPREKVARIVDPAAFLFTTDELMKGDTSQYDALRKADAILTALASSGDHAELAAWFATQGARHRPNADKYQQASSALTSLIAEVAALRGENDRLAFETDDATLAALQSRATEAERKLAEAVGVVEWYGENARLARLIHSEGDAGRNALADDGGKRARTFLSKEAERG